MSSSSNKNNTIRGGNIINNINVHSHNNHQAATPPFRRNEKAILAHPQTVVPREEIANVGREALQVVTKQMCIFMYSNIVPEKSWLSYVYAFLLRTNATVSLEDVKKYAVKYNKAHYFDVEYLDPNDLGNWPFDVLTSFFLANLSSLVKGCRVSLYTLTKLLTKMLKHYCMWNRVGAKEGTKVFYQLLKCSEKILYAISPSKRIVKEMEEMVLAYKNKIYPDLIQLKNSLDAEKQKKMEESYEELKNYAVRRALKRKREQKRDASTANFFDEDSSEEDDNTNVGEPTDAENEAHDSNEGNDCNINNNEKDHEEDDAKEIGEAGEEEEDKLKGRRENAQEAEEVPEHKYNLRGSKGKRQKVGSAKKHAKKSGRGRKF